MDEKTKKPTGRPRTYAEPVTAFTVRLPESSMKKLDTYCALECRTRTQAAAFLLMKALDAYTKH